MSRASWLGRPAGRHAAPGRRRARAEAGSEPDSAETASPQTPPALPAAGPAGIVPVGPEPTGTRPAPEVPPWERVPSAAPGMLGAPVLADAGPAPLVSPVTDAARAAAAASSASLPAFVPPGAAPLVTINALGRKCPIPIILLAEQIRDVPVGSVIAVLADDPAAYPDIPAWCGLKSHDCVFRVEYATGWSFGVRRRY